MKSWIGLVNLKTLFLNLVNCYCFFWLEIHVNGLFGNMQQNVLLILNYSSCSSHKDLLLWMLDLSGNASWLIVAIPNSGVLWTPSTTEASSPHHSVKKNWFPGRWSCQETLYSLEGNYIFTEEEQQKRWISRVSAAWKLYCWVSTSCAG